MHNKLVRSYFDEMFLNLHLDATSSFHILCSTKKSLSNPRVSVSPSEQIVIINKPRERTLLDSPNKGKRIARIDRRNHGKSRFDVSESQFDKHRFQTGREHSECESIDSKVVDKEGIRVDHKVNSIEEMQVKCSTKCLAKWMKYGGCIPAILQALETVNDLDEALKPWEESLSNKERTIILKEQSNWERCIEIFEWFKRKNCYELNVIHYNIMIKILGKSRKWRYINNLWDEMNSKKIQPTNSTYGTLIDVYNKGGFRKEALSWLAKMNKQGMKPDEFTMGIVLQMYKMAGEFKTAEKFFKRWSSSDVCLSSHTYNTLIDTYGKAGKLPEASETFAKMLREGIAPTTVTFNTMIHICGNHGRLEEVTSLMNKMEELRCCSPDTRTYNILISVFLKHDDIDVAGNYFTKMKESRLQPDSVSYRTMLYAYSIRGMVDEAEDLVHEMDEEDLEIDEYTQSALTRMYIEAGMLEKSWLWFSRFHTTGNLSSDGYSAVIDAYGERGHCLQAEKAFVCCKENNKPTVLEFNVMIKAYGIAKEYEKASGLFDSMKLHGVVPDNCTYNSLVQIFVNADMPHKAKPYLRKMQAVGIVTDSSYNSDCATYSVVISSFVKLRQPEMAEEVYNEMITNNVKPDVFVYGVLINAFADNGNIEKALFFVALMKNAGISENAVVYSILLKLYTKVGYVKEAEETFNKLFRSSEMEAAEVEVGPDVYSLNCMIDLYGQRFMVKQAEPLFGYSMKKGEPNEFTFAMMLRMYKRTGRFEEATRVAKEMRERFLLTDLSSYNNVLGLYALDGRFKDAYITFEEMMVKGIRPDESTFESLGSVLVKCGISKKAVKKLEVTMKEDFDRGLKAWLSILSSVVDMVEDVDDDYF